MKVLVTGADGMLGQDFCPIFEQAGYEVIRTNRQNFDITDFKNVKKTILTMKPDIIAHLAAYTKVDLAEDNKEEAALINYKATENLAKFADKADALMVYISTDYIFDGKKDTPYEPNDLTNPINTYGMTKLMGENVVMQNVRRYYIARTSWLYGPFGKNFVSTMLKLAQNNQTINVVDDQTGSPTYTVDLANAILELITKDYPFGIYHISNEGETTWYNFAKEVFKLQNLNPICLPTTSDKYITAAKRPKYSVLKNAIKMRNWKDGLKDYLMRI